VEWIRVAEIWSSDGFFGKKKGTFGSINGGTNFGQLSDYLFLEKDSAQCSWLV
jgi:hypothetical protein